MILSLWFQAALSRKKTKKLKTAPKSTHSMYFKRHFFHLFTEKIKTSKTITIKIQHKKQKKAPLVNADCRFTTKYKNKNKNMLQIKNHVFWQTEYVNESEISSCKQWLIVSFIKNTQNTIFHGRNTECKHKITSIATCAKTNYILLNQTKLKSYPQNNTRCIVWYNKYINVYIGLIKTKQCCCTTKLFLIIFILFNIKMKTKPSIKMSWEKKSIIFALMW